MPRLSPNARNVLSATQVKNYSKPGTVCDGGGLYLKITRQGTKSWVFRYKLSKPHNMGLGAYPEVSLSEARERASEARRQLRDGLDPLKEKQRRKQELAGQLTFKEVKDQWFKASESGWTKKHKGQVKNTLETYASSLDSIPIGQIDTQNVLECIGDLWIEKNETAYRVRGRIEAVLDYATAIGLREGNNPARWQGHLSYLLPARSKIAPVQHLEALPYKDMPEFMSKLRKQEGFSPRALEFTILTAMRVGAVVATEWSEIEGNIWTVPAGRMKGQTTDFKVPLSKQAISLLDELPRVDDSPYLFPSTKGHITIASPLALLKRRMGYKDLTVHGFRSTFRDWSAEQTSYAHHIQEMALAHTIDSKVERAYRRGDLFTKRTRLMQEWANFLDTKGQIHDVIRMDSRR